MKIGYSQKFLQNTKDETKVNHELLYQYVLGQKCDFHLKLHFTLQEQAGG